jgi:hypothetical protein
LLHFPESCPRNCSQAQTRKRTGFYFKLFSHYKIPICIAAVIPPTFGPFSRFKHPLSLPVIPVWVVAPRIATTQHTVMSEGLLRMQAQLRIT